MCITPTTNCGGVAESDECAVRPGARMVHGTFEAHAAIPAMLDEWVETYEERTLLASLRRGRPSLYPSAKLGTTSPMWRVRALEDLNAAAPARAEAEGRDPSALVCDADQAYLPAS